MERIVIRLTRRVKKRLRQTRRTTRDTGLAQRCQIVLHAAKGRPSRTIAEVVGCSRSWVSRVLQRFLKDGEAAVRGEFERLRPLTRTGGFIPSVDHQTPPGVSMEQYRVYLRLLAEYARG